MLDKSIQDAHKRAAAERAVLEIKDGMLVGLGSGTTATHAIRALALRVAGGLRITAIPTSHATEVLARDLGIVITDFRLRHRIDVTIDGADQVSLVLDKTPALRFGEAQAPLGLESISRSKAIAKCSGFNLIKGLGGALVREKIVAAATDRMIVVVDETKLVPMLGDLTRLPVEISSFGWESVLDRLGELGCEPKIRWAGQRPFKSDGGNYIADCRFSEIADPLALEARLAGIVGVIESGLFIDMVSAVMVGRPTGVEVILS